MSPRVNPMTVMTLTATPIKRQMESLEERVDYVEDGGGTIKYSEEIIH
jgi:hypothetical protein